MFIGELFAGLAVLVFEQLEFLSESGKDLGLGCGACGACLTDRLLVQNDHLVFGLVEEAVKS